MKRFTETQKWEDPWFRRLSPELKLLWCWLLDRCDNAGVIDPDVELASFQIGYQYPMDTLSEFGDRVEVLGCGKYFIPKFIEFQYGELSKDCRAHNPIFISLKKHGLEGYPYPMDRVQEKEKEKEKEKKGESREGRKSTTTLSVDELVADGLQRETAEEWLAHRKRKKAPMTPIAWRGIKQEAAKSGMSIEDAVCEALKKGWQSFDASWMNGRQATLPLNGKTHRAGECVSPTKYAPIETD